MIEIHRRVTKPVHALVGTEEIFEVVGGDGGGAHYALETTACPDCKTAGSLATHFPDRSPCPVCKTGKIRSDLIEY